MKGGKKEEGQKEGWEEMREGKKKHGLSAGNWWLSLSFKFSEVGIKKTAFYNAWCSSALSTDLFKFIFAIPGIGQHKQTLSVFINYLLYLNYT